MLSLKGIPPLLSISVLRFLGKSTLIIISNYITFLYVTSELNRHLYKLFLQRYFLSCGSVCLSVYMGGSVCLSVCMSVCLYTWVVLSVCLYPWAGQSVCLSVYMGGSVCIRRWVCMSVCIHGWFCLSVCIGWRVCLSVYAVPY